MKLIFSIDDGDELDIKTAELFKKYNIPAIFYIPTSCKLHPKDIRRLDEMGFIIGGHTTTHPRDMKLLRGVNLEAEVVENKEWLEGIIGKEIIHFCYPRGRYNEDVTKAVEKVGFKYARTVDVGNYLLPLNKYRVGTSVHIYPRREYKGKAWLDYALDLLDKADKDEDGYFHCWAHSWEIDKFNEWYNLEKLLKVINEYKYEPGKY